MKTVTLAHNSYAWLGRIRQWLLDALFPRRCLNCGRWGEWCCAVCLASFNYPRRLTCPDCQTTTNLGEFCADCSHSHALRGLWPAQNYGQPALRALIKALKFDGVIEAAPYLANLVHGLMRSFNLPPAWHQVPKDQWCLTSVPLAPRRERRRDFNQADIIANLISQTENLPYQPTLKRVLVTKPQSEISDERVRKDNVQGAFQILPEADVVGRVFVLVDDVYTTGATMEACAKVLKLAGAREVWGLVVAKG